MKWKLKENVELYDGEEFYYDLTDGGYIKLEDYLEDEKQIKKLKEAISLIRSFENTICEE